jgi:hypothetical protein
MQQSRVDWYLSIGRLVVCHRGPLVGNGLDASPEELHRQIDLRTLRVMNAGSDENFIAEPAEFREF